MPDFPHPFPFPLFQSGIDDTGALAQARSYLPFVLSVSLYLRPRLKKSAYYRHGAAEAAEAGTPLDLSAPRERETKREKGRPRTRFFSSGIHRCSQSPRTAGLDAQAGWPVHLCPSYALRKQCAAGDFHVNTLRGTKFWRDCTSLRRMCRDWAICRVPCRLVRRCSRGARIAGAALARFAANDASPRSTARREFSSPPPLFLPSFSSGLTLRFEPPCRHSERKQSPHTPPPSMECSLAAPKLQPSFMRPAPPRTTLPL